MYDDDVSPWQNRGAWIVALGLMFAPAILIAALVALLLAGCSGCATDLPTQRSHSAAGAQWIDAGHLADICAVDGRACVAYLAATDDLIIVGAGRRPYCAPSKITLSALRAAFLDFVDAHPDARSYPATLIALSAWSEAWPCDAAGSAEPDRRAAPGTYKL